MRSSSYWLLHYQNRKTTDLFLKILYAPERLRIVCFTGVQTAQDSQLQTVNEELFQANDFDVEDSIVYKQLVHDDHTTTVSLTSTIREFTEKIC
jgi:hypothetical protein